MKGYKTILLILFSILSCQREIEQNENTIENAVPMSFYAGIETPKDSSLTKTVLDGAPSDAFRNVLWEYQDEICVTNGSQSSKFINTSQGTSEIALLQGELAEGTNYFAAYPFNIVTKFASSSFSIDLPSEQLYCTDGFESETFPMVAQCEDGVFNFKNLCGILVVQLLGDQTITSVTFSGKDSDGNYLPVAGKGTVAVDYSDVPTLVMDNSSNTSVSLISSTGVKLSTATPTSFHIVLPSEIYDTFELVIRTKEGSKMLLQSSKPLNIKRSQRTTAAALTYVDVIDLSSTGTANCYIVSEQGKYKFNASVKGNSVESIGEAVSAEVLWESFGTDVTPSVGDIVRNVSYKDGYIEFETPSVFAEGNALVAAKDASGTILWSWHIWVTDEPEDHIYPKNTGIMMDRNLGATSNTPGDVGALGLLYQWGRKDPFLGSSSISEGIVAKSTGTWTSIDMGASVGNVSYVTNNPTTFIRGYASSYDWFYHSPKNDLWDSTKSVYDPCPLGWKVPDNTYTWNACESYSFDQQKGGSFYEIDNQTSAWYPAAGDTYNRTTLTDVGTFGGYWTSAIGSSNKAHRKYTHNNSYDTSGRAYGSSVRCMRDESFIPPAETPEEYKNLSTDETANCYIISETGKYKFNGWVKGNSSESVGVVDRAEVLWESFGTDVTPSVGDIVRNVSYKDGYIEFETPSSFVEGNAVIAAKDALGTILWSWHIWLTDQPKEQVYFNNAGIMMDRNLGATSATPGEATALGLLYYWGRKDPFLGSSSITEEIPAESTITWPKEVQSDPERNISYTIEHPTTSITSAGTSVYGWEWPIDGIPNLELWQHEKTIYDPCPVGWRVPDGGDDGIWAKAIGNADFSVDYDNGGINFSGIFGDDSVIWYPAQDYLRYSSMGSIHRASKGLYWSCTPQDITWGTVYNFEFKYTNEVSISSGTRETDTEMNIRCTKE